MALRIVHWACRIILAGIFLYSGYIKIESPLQFAATLSSYQLFPSSLLLPLSTYFPWIEIVLGASMLVGWRLPWFAAATAGLLSVFTVLLAVTYLRGIEADCGCFGPGDRISPLTIARDASFLLPALFLAAEAWIRGRLKRVSP
jgi:uncharacterized membrane protein YphA (DoxX/SURF4 family)